jgi:hypothetical protein
MDELIQGPYGIRWREFAEQAPKPWEIPLGKNPVQIFTDCKVETNPEENGPEFVNRAFTWYARAAQRAMPEPRLRDEVAALVKRRLREKRWLRARAC